MKFRHRPANSFGKRLRHLVEPLPVRDVYAGELDGNSRRRYRAQLPYGGGVWCFRRTFKPAHEFGLREIR
jgi:hypothetical protein